MFSNLASLIGGKPLVDVRRQATPEEFLRSYKRATTFQSLPRPAQAGISQVLVRKLEQNGLMGYWNADGEKVLRLLEQA